VCGEPLTEGHIPIATATSAFMRVINWLSASRDFRFSGAKVHMLKVILDPVNGEFRNMSQIARECQISRATLSKAFTDLRTRYGWAAGKLDSSRATYRETQLKLVAAGRHASNVVRKNHDGVGAPESPITMKTTTEP
jgi:hypothetical protein